MSLCYLPKPPLLHRLSLDSKDHHGFLCSSISMRVPVLCASLRLLIAAHASPILEYMYSTLLCTPIELPVLPHCAPTFYCGHVIPAAAFSQRHLLPCFCDLSSTVFPETLCSCAPIASYSFDLSTPCFQRLLLMFPVTPLPQYFQTLLHPCAP